MFELKDLIGLLDAKVNVTSVLLVVGAALGGVYVVKRVAGVVTGLAAALLSHIPFRPLFYGTLILAGTGSLGTGLGDLFSINKIGGNGITIEASRLANLAGNENTNPENLKQVLAYAENTYKRNPVIIKDNPNANDPRLTGFLIVFGLALTVTGGVCAALHYNESGYR